MPTFQTADGTSLFYSEWGQGEPILFLNSLGFGIRMWDYQFAALAEQGFRCIGLDRRRSHVFNPGYRHPVDFAAQRVFAIGRKTHESVAVNSVGFSRGNRRRHRLCVRCTRVRVT